MTFIDDDGNELQLESQFAMTKQAVSFFSGAIKGDVSITFSVDNNSANRKVLGYNGPQMTNQVAWTKQPFNRVKNGNIIDRGYIVIQSDNGDTLSCFYVSGNSNWIQKFNGLITEIQWPRPKSSNLFQTANPNTVRLDKYWRYLLFSAYYTSYETEGIIFPFVDWAYNLKKGNNLYHASVLIDSRHDGSVNGGVDATPTEHFYFDFYPCLYVHSLISEMCSDQGVKISGNLLSDKIYKSLIITPTNGQMTRPESKISYAYGSSQGGFLNNTFIQYTSFNSELDPYDTISTSGYTANGVYGLRVTAEILGVTSINDNIGVYRNGIAIYTRPVHLNNNKITFDVIPVVAGDFISLYIRNTSGVTVSFTLNASFEVPKNIGLGDIVNPSNFLPEIKCIDVLKFVFNLFGCSVYYNEISKTLTANIIERINVNDAIDWSDKYISHSVNYTIDSAQNNYIDYAKETEFDYNIKNYNKANTLKFGSGNIETGNTLKERKTISTFPFTASVSGLAINGSYVANIPLVDLIDEGEPIDFSAISASGNFCAYTVPDGTMFTYNEIVRITNSSGNNRGYFSVDTDGSGTTVDIRDYPFTTTDTGKIYKQRIEFNDIGPRILSVRNGVAFSDINPSSEWLLSTFTNDQSLINAAYFTKEITGMNIDSLKGNLAIDNPTGNYQDPTIKELYLNKISRFINNPTIKARMILPESVYQSFVFDQFIYLKTEKLTGYFFVDSIVNYVDGNTPVEVNLYML